jgi:hypothetical protein
MNIVEVGVIASSAALLVVYFLPAIRAHFERCKLTKQWSRRGETCALLFDLIAPRSSSLSFGPEISRATINHRRLVE